MKRWMAFAKKLSVYGIHPQHRLGAVVVRGGSVLSTGVNVAKPYGKDNGGRHAEVRALMPHYDFRGATLYVARENGGASKPCPNCMAAIRRAGISKIVYVGSDRQIYQERL